ncbi:Protein-glutamine gamma-glutamyltransferase [compost metagenome]
MSLPKNISGLLARPTLRPLSPEKTNTLLLLCACALVLLPNVFYLPPWVSAVICAMLLWRGWITFRGNRMPSRWLLLPLALLTLGGVYLTFRTLVGSEAGVAVLSLLLTFKLLEMHARRDLFAVVFLTYFLLLTNFFNSQSLATALLTVVTLILLLSAQLSFQYTGAIPPLRKRLLLTSKILALAIPLTIVLFILFPRIQGPLWAMPSDAKTARSGLSSSMSPGNIAKLALSPEVAFRVKFADPVPASNQLYWRAIVLDHFDGLSWTKSLQRRGEQPATRLMRGTAVRYQVTQEASSQPWLFALELPSGAPQLAGKFIVSTVDEELRSNRPINERIRYDVTSHLDFALIPQAERTSVRQWLALPANFNPRTLALAAQIKRTAGDENKAIKQVLQNFRTEAFRYTLEPPPLGINSVDDFLFTTRAGFCEHYASAFVVLMRAMGIPARVVTGYQGGQINPVDGYMTIRQSDAHAWAEVWLEQQGWVRIDPTAAVAPERVERNAGAATADAALGGLVNDGSEAAGWLRGMRFQWEALNNGWNQWVLNYTPDQQKSLLGSLGFGNIDWQTMVLLLLAVGGTVTAAMAFLLLGYRRKSDPIHAAYAQFCKQMARHGYPRLPHEGPRSYSNRLLADDSALTQKRKHAAGKFMTLYENLRYGRAEQLSPTHALSTLKSLLNQIR